MAQSIDRTAEPSQPTSPERIKRVQALLDKHVVEGLTQIHAAFFRQKELAGTGRAVSVARYDTMRTNLRRAHYETKYAGNKESLNPLCTNLDEIKRNAREGFFRNGDFENDLISIIDSQRAAFEAAFKELANESPMVEKPDEEYSVEIDQSYYEQIITFEVQKWFDQTFPSLFEGIQPLFLSKDIIEKVEKRFRDLIYTDIPLLFTEQFPLKGKVEASNADKESCISSLIDLITQAIAEVTQKKGLGSKDIERLKSCGREMALKIDFIDTIIQKKICSRLAMSELQAMAEREEVFGAKLKHQIQAAFLGNARYEYATREDKKEPFRATPENILYPEELQALTQMVGQLIEGRGFTKRTTVLELLHSDTGLETLIDAADRLNNTFHCGLPIRSDEDLKQIALEFIDKYFPEDDAPASSHRTTEAAASDSARVIITLDERGQFALATDLAQIGHYGEVPAEAASAASTLVTEPEIHVEAVTVEEEPHDPTGPITVRQPSTHDLEHHVEPTPERPPVLAEPATSIEAAAPKLAELEQEPTPPSPRTLHFDLSYLPAEDLTPEERPSHVPENIFNRINEVLRWARKADKAGARSIHRLVLAKTLILTQHLSVLSLDKIMHDLVDLESIKELLPNFKVEKSGEGARVENWVKVLMESAKELEPGEENDLGNRLTMQLKKIQQKIIKLEQELATMMPIQLHIESLRAKAEELQRRLESKCLEEKGKNAEVSNLQQGLTQVKVGSVEFSRILTGLQELNTALIELTAQKQELETTAKENEQELAQLDGKFKESEALNQRLTLLKAERTRAFESISQILDHLEALTIEDSGSSQHDKE